MKNTTIKILTCISIILLGCLRCGDIDVVGIYNKYTAHYRETPDDMLEHSDSCITVRVFSSHSNLPLSNTNVILTIPTNDTIAASTNKDGFAVFMPTVITKGSYSVKASVNINGTEYSRMNTYYLNEKNNSTLIIYINEKIEK